MAKPPSLNPHVIFSRLCPPHSQIHSVHCRTCGATSCSSGKTCGIARVTLAKKSKAFALIRAPGTDCSKGLPTFIGVAKTDSSRGYFVYDEDAACIFTGPFTITAWRNGRPDERDTAQLATPSKYIHGQRPAPKLLGPSLRPCPSCWS